MHNHCNCGGGCGCSRVGKVLLVVGGLNWGLVGLGMLTNMSDWNVVHMLLGSMPVVEAIVYILVGVAALMKLVGCRCAKCRAACTTCSSSGSGSDNMGQ